MSSTDNWSVIPARFRESIDWSAGSESFWTKIADAGTALSARFADFAEAIFDATDRSPALKAVRRKVARLAVRADEGVLTLRRKAHLAWEWFARTFPALADLILVSRRSYLASLTRWRGCRQAHPWLDGAILSFGLLAFISMVEGVIGNPTGAQPLYILPIWLGVKLAGPIVGFIQAMFVSGILAAAGDVPYRGHLYLQPNNLLRFASLTILMMIIWHVENRLQAAQKLAKTDPLTGVWNRGEIERRVTHALTNWHAKGRPISMALVDCDRFKEVNDTLGHAFGDHVLRTLARRLSSVSKGQGFVGRLGGDEFIVFFEGLDASDARARLRTAAHGFSKYLSGIGHTVTISYGVVQVDAKTATREALFATADALMYARKRAGHAELH